MKRMLFNATHAEELRVATVDGQKLIDFDVEVAGREQKKSNVYKGVVTRIEPSLEACFVNYGEERHGFLPFKEIAKEFQKSSFSTNSDQKNKAPIIEGTEVLVQIEKEERGNKGAALTTYISLAGRYLVLMPNNPRGGGVSRRIEGEERQELKDTIDKLNLVSGMSVIARTAGIGRSLDELQWDLTYLIQLWNAISGAKSLQPGAYLIFQESSLVIRAIRDYFHPEIGEILVDTDEIFDQAKQFMQHVMPDMENRVKKYSEDYPLYSRYQIEHQIETAYSRVVQLPLGGAIVIDHTEALVAIDVNSARSTKGTDIEDTAFKTNLEAAEEIGRQLRLRDLGGLIVIDFIDMEATKNQRDVENCLKDSLSIDRARVQMGRISRFGLVELSRQRLRPALNEGSHIICGRCNGVGVIRDINSSALHILRIIQEESIKEGTSSIYVQVPIEVATFLLNEKRTDLATLEVQLKVTVILIPNKFIETPNYSIERIKFEDPRLDENKPSYKIIDTPSSDLMLNNGKKRGHPSNIQKAVIKGIESQTPAPVNRSGKSENFISKIFKLLISPFKSEKKTKKTKKIIKHRTSNKRKQKIDSIQNNRKPNLPYKKDKRKNTTSSTEQKKSSFTSQNDKINRKDNQPRAKNSNDNVNIIANSVKNNSNDKDKNLTRSEEKQSSTSNEQSSDRLRKRKRKPTRVRDEKSETFVKSEKNISNIKPDIKNLGKTTANDMALPTISNESQPFTGADIDNNLKTNKIEDKDAVLNETKQEKKDHSLVDLEKNIKSSGLEWIQTKHRHKVIPNDDSKKLGRKIERKKELVSSMSDLKMIETKK
ncbi:MAG: hypothetical protein CBD16_01370 [Betaproteobacteria bacterium TMED156]|nr:MAG: hypothetical protein CBD16_01370 [Betaproteobacteria bacterium TMED156]